MAAGQRRYSKEEFARRGDALVESKVRPSLTAADEDNFVAIDIETGEYELDKNEIKAVDRLRKRVADPTITRSHFFSARNHTGNSTRLAMAMHFSGTFASVSRSTTSRT